MVVQVETALQQVSFVFVFGLFVFALIFIKNLRGFLSAKKSLKDVFMWAMIANTVLIAICVFGLLRQFIPMATMFFVVVIISLVRYRKTMKAQNVIVKDIVSSAKGKDFTFSDFFAKGGWIKLALKYGAPKAAFLFFVVQAVSLVVIFFIMGLFTPFSVIKLAIIGVVASAFGAWSFYKKMDKHIKH
ncbi:hypothetical protein HQ545_01890 [Candidatus Woesearchaeota archaeon]|nr:hypothetical protein [Candidatus Woesearchaeota archaeon]